ncbi:MAG: hypothetical protein K9G26_03830 [Emcibacter sp.]|nr:hypothetical protein [Emcibacter sp.]
MATFSLACPICGAKILTSNNIFGFNCAFCGFERKSVMEKKTHSQFTLKTSFRDIPKLMKIHKIPEIFIEGIQPTEPHYKDITLSPLNKEHINLDGIWSDMIIPFEADISLFFQEKFRQLKPHGLLYLSAPVKRLFQKNEPYYGQINFFKAKNIMFLLEQHGFKMVWRKNRFSQNLRIIARKC